jgi:hypothetical protein
VCSRHLSRELIELDFVQGMRREPLEPTAKVCSGSEHASA